MFPVGVNIDPKSGEVQPATGRYAKRVGELRSIYQESPTPDSADDRALAYEVIEYRAEGSEYHSVDRSTEVRVQWRLLASSAS